MIGQLGNFQFGTIESPYPLTPAGKKIVIVGDSSDHGGTVINSNQDGTLVVVFTVIGSNVGLGAMWGSFVYAGLPEEFVDEGREVAVNGALHSCPILFHGVTPVTAVTVKSFHNSKLILTKDAVAGCGAKITPPNRRVYVE